MNIIRLILLWILATGSTLADDGERSGDRIHQTAFGMDCEPCAVGIERGISGLAGIAGVEVDLESGIIAIDLTDDAEPDMAAIRQTILDNGFTPRSAKLRLTGRIIEFNDGYGLAIGEQRFALDHANAPDDGTIADSLNRMSIVKGTMPAGQDDRIAVESITDTSITERSN